MKTVKRCRNYIISFITKQLKNIFRLILMNFTICIMISKNILLRRSLAKLISKWLKCQYKWTKIALLHICEHTLDTIHIWRSFQIYKILFRKWLNKFHRISKLYVCLTILGLIVWLEMIWINDFKIIIYQYLNEY